MQKIIGYHGTKNTHANKIMLEGFKIPAPKEGDNHWLGHGIYFFDNYDLAEWWANAKVNRQNKKYNNNDSTSIIKATILSNNTLDLDNPFHLQKFKKYQLELQAQLLETGIQLDFTKGKGFVEERTRCFWSDLIKEQYNIDVLIYTFTKRNPSYIENKYRIINNSKNPLNNIGLSYHEKQICVTKNSSIIDKAIVNNCIKDFDEVII